VAASIVAAILGASVALAGVGTHTVFAPGPPVSPPPPGRVTIDHISLIISYPPGMAYVFGPPNQQLCGLCPLVLVGGSVASLAFLTIAVPSNHSQVHFWLNVTSPIPAALGCSPLSPPSANGSVNPGCRYGTDLHNIETFLGPGNSNGFILALAVPSPAPVLYAGAGIDVTIIIHSS
jgi:hypothetical protein